MKRLFVIAFILLAVTSYGQPTPAIKSMNVDSFIQDVNDKRSAWIGKAYPEFSVTTNNTEYSNQKLKGKTVFANFWFAACKPCMDEMEDLNKLYDKYRSNPNFEFISFTYENAEQIEIIRKKYNIHYKIFSIPIDECYRLNLRGGFPTNLVIGANGAIKYVSLLEETGNRFEKMYKVISGSL